MSLDYDTIAPRYDAHRTARGPYFEPLIDLVRAHGPRVLEIGAGTGNMTAAVVEACAPALTALEPSRGMAAQARAKGVGGNWVRGEGAALPFASAAFDFIYGVYMLHHVPNLGALFRECHRATGGCAAAFVTVPEGFIRSHPMNAYFPSFAEIDLARFQPVREVESAMRGAGFATVRVIPTIDPPRPVDAAYVEKIANRFISTYELIPSVEFEAGLARLRRDVSKRGRLDVSIEREAVIVYGSGGEAAVL